MEPETTPEAAPNNGVVHSLRGDKPTEQTVLRVEKAELRRLQTFAERKLELEQMIVAAQLQATTAALELKDVNEKFAAVQQSVAARLGIVGSFQVAPDGVVILPQP